MEPNLKHPSQFQKGNRPAQFVSLQEEKDEIEHIVEDKCKVDDCEEEEGEGDSEEQGQHLLASLSHLPKSLLVGGKGMGVYNEGNIRITPSVEQCLNRNASLFSCVRGSYPIVDEEFIHKNQQLLFLDQWGKGMYRRFFTLIGDHDSRFQAGAPLWNGFDERTIMVVVLKFPLRGQPLSSESQGSKCPVFSQSNQHRKDQYGANSVKLPAGRRFVLVTENGFPIAAHLPHSVKLPQPLDPNSGTLYEELQGAFAQGFREGLFRKSAAKTPFSKIRDVYAGDSGVSRGGYSSLNLNKGSQIGLWSQSLTDNANFKGLQQLRLLIIRVLASVEPIAKAIGTGFLDYSKLQEGAFVPQAVPFTGFAVSWQEARSFHTDTNDAPGALTCLIVVSDNGFDLEQGGFLMRSATVVIELPLCKDSVTIFNQRYQHAVQADVRPGMSGKDKPGTAEEFLSSSHRFLFGFYTNQAVMSRMINQYNTKE
jgi:hypothetical protein